LRLELLKNTPRGRKVVERVAEIANWGRKRDGRGLGFAFIDYSGTLTAGIAEASMIEATDRSTSKHQSHMRSLLGILDRCMYADEPLWREYRAFVPNRMLSAPQCGANGCKQSASINGKVAAPTPRRTAEGTVVAGRAHAPRACTAIHSRDLSRHLGRHTQSFRLPVIRAGCGKMSRPDGSAPSNQHSNEFLRK
jgi:hypothetical protein